MSVRLALILAASPAGGLAAVPPPPDQTGANCAQPEYATDQLVCANADLLRLDRAMQHLLSVTPIADDANWIEPQFAWLRRRSLCAFEAAHFACALHAYTQRIAVLAVMAAPAPVHGNAMICADTAVFAAALPGQTLRLFDRAGKLIGFASLAAKPEDGWRSFAQYSQKHGQITVDFADGQSLQCRPARSQDQTVRAAK